MARILVIDDDRALCRSLELTLSGEGHSVTSVFTAAEGENAAVGTAASALPNEL